MFSEESHIKLVVFVKRNPNASFEDFQSYYENVHSKLIEHLPDTRRYFRRYLHPLGQQLIAPDGPSYDVLAELWFDSMADLESSMRILANPELHQAGAEEEARFIDHTATRLYVVDERHSNLTVGRVAAE